MSDESPARSELPNWIFAFGPFLVIGSVVLLALAVVSVADFDWLRATETTNVLAVLTVIGFVAGILPVFIGMLWFPYIRQLDPKWIHAVLAFSAGILAFIAFEMGGEAAEHALEVPNPMFGASVAFVAAIGTIGLMEGTSRWRRDKSAGSGADGLRVAYLIAIGLGLHSVGEGLAIGSAFVLGESGLVALLIVGFILHNVTEGPAVISAVARDATSPPIRHFVVLGSLAGGGVIVGGWLGSLVDSALLAAVCFSVAFGAIIQVLWEMRGLIRADADTLITRRIVVAFVVGIVVMFTLEEIIVGSLLLG